MAGLDLFFLIIIFFVTSLIGVVTGSNSLITVPAMFQFGIDPKVAVATNMFGLTFMSIGASIPFIKRREVDYKKLAPIILITLVASAIGALLVGIISTRAIPIVVSISMILVAVFILIWRDPGSDAPAPSNKAKIVTFALAFLLGIYGGLYSGGYVTILTAVLVAFYGVNFTAAIAGTKFINIFSSGIATLVFAWQGLIDYLLGIILAVTMFAAAYFGATFIAQVNETWLKRIFLSAVFLLALKTIFDIAS